MIRPCAALVLTSGIAGCAATGLPPDDPAGTETWVCGSVVLVADLENGLGTVDFGAGAEITDFRIQGIERRWNWCLGDDGAFNCAFTIDPDGDGLYFNFGAVMPDADGISRTKPSDFFKCRRRGSRPVQVMRPLP